VPVPSQMSERSCIHIRVPVPSQMSERSCIHIRVPVPSQMSERSCIHCVCVLWVSIVSLYSFSIRFWTVLTAFCFSIDFSYVLEFSRRLIFFLFFICRYFKRSFVHLRTRTFEHFLYNVIQLHTSNGVLKILSQNKNSENGF
jgi:hypothetical protein